MEVVFQLHRHLQELPEDKSGPGLDLKKILEKIKKKGLQLTTLSFSGQDAEANFYRIEIDNASLANEIVTDLLNHPFVDAAYIKPTDESPEN